MFLVSSSSCTIFVLSPILSSSSSCCNIFITRNHDFHDTLWLCPKYSHVVICTNGLDITNHEYIIYMTSIMITWLTKQYDYKISEPQLRVKKPVLWCFRTSPSVKVKMVLWFFWEPVGGRYIYTLPLPTVSRFWEVRIDWHWWR
jgi:hypothetical protein